MGNLPPPAAFSTSSLSIESNKRAKAPMRRLGEGLWSISRQANFISVALSGRVGTIWVWWFIARQDADPLPSNAALMQEN
jgi:hypothetical protein